MANIFRKILYSPVECAILDFIKDNKDNVKYQTSTKFDKFSVDIGTVHTVSIRANGMALEAQMTKYKTNFPFGDTDVSYTFKCTNSGTNKDGICKDCTYVKPISEFSGFASRVYTKMLNYYVAKHGNPVER